MPGAGFLVGTRAPPPPLISETLTTVYKCTRTSYTISNDSNKFSLTSLLQVCNTLKSLISGNLCPVSEQLFAIAL